MLFSVLIRFLIALFEPPVVTITTDDMLFTVETVSCLGACGLASTLTVNNEVHPSMTTEKALELITELRGDNVL